MKNKKPILIIIAILTIIIVSGLVIFSNKEHKLTTGEQPLFKVSKATEKIIVDGKMDEAIWKTTEARSFNYFYNVEKPTDKQNTIFRMLWDEENLYLFYQSEDKYITAREKVRDGAPYFDDCAEIFLIPAPESLDMHFCFEINLYKTPNDIVYLDNFYKGKKGVIKAFNPTFEIGVTVDGTLNDNSDIDKGWSMELAIPLKTFRGTNSYHPVKEGTKWAFLAIRQERNEVEGERRVTSTLFPIYDIEKDVHQANRFGLLEFVK